MSKTWTLIPALAFLGLIALFATRLNDSSPFPPSALIDQPLPALDLPPIPGRDRPLRSEDMLGSVSLLNVFGSWCIACAAEHGMLMRIKAEGVVPLHGIDWREKNPGDGGRWLNKHGDPYDRIGIDPDSRAAIALGVSGAPETFVIDAQGVIRYKHSGPIDEKVWTETLHPLIEALRQ